MLRVKIYRDKSSRQIRQSPQRNRRQYDDFYPFPYAHAATFTIWPLGLRS